MPFSRSSLAALAYANGVRVWRYGPTPDARAAVTAADYFATSGIGRGDVVLAGCADGAALLAVPMAGAAVPVSLLAAPDDNGAITHLGQPVTFGGQPVTAGA
jgi:hypothetical protein